MAGGAILRPLTLMQTDPHAAAPLLQMTGISKSFPGVKALENVNFAVGAAEIHAFLGENGAGKSTLLKILSGAQAPDTGTIALDGKETVFATPQDAQRAGIVTIYQEFTLAPDMSIAENVFVGRELGSRFFVNHRLMEEETRKISKRIGLDRDPGTRVRDLAVAEQQMVEIARALSMKSRIIVMDEPTSALSRSEVEKLFTIVRGLKAEGISTIFVTHRLEEVFEICDRYTVLRDGRNAGAGSVAETSIEGIIRMMVGRDVGLLAHRQGSFAQSEVALEVKGLNRRRKATDASAIELHDVAFKVHKGEILGLAGLVGAGRTESARAIFGADPLDSGEVLVGGKPVRIASPVANTALPANNKVEIPSGATTAPKATGTTTDTLLLKTERKPTASPPRPGGEAACRSDSRLGWLIPTAAPKISPSVINSGATTAHGSAMKTHTTTASDTRRICHSFARCDSQGIAARARKVPSANSENTVPMTDAE